MRKVHSTRTTTNSSERIRTNPNEWRGDGRSAAASTNLLPPPPLVRRKRNSGVASRREVLAQKARLVIGP